MSYGDPLPVKGVMIDFGAVVGTILYWSPYGDPTELEGIRATVPCPKENSVKKASAKVVKVFICRDCERSINYKLILQRLKIKDIDLDYLIEHHIEFIKGELKYYKQIEKGN